MATTQNKIIIILIAVLFVAIAIGALVIVLTSSPEDVSNGSDTILPVSATFQGFDVRVFQSQDYQKLNLQPIIERLLPVQPPEIIGKANPFLP